MSGLPKEVLTEETIVKFLTSQPILDANGQPTTDMEYRQIDAAEYNQNAQNKENCILTSELIAFLKDTQPKEYQKMLDVLGSEEQVASSILSRIGTEMKTKLRAATSANVHNKNCFLLAHYHCSAMGSWTLVMVLSLPCSMRVLPATRTRNMMCSIEKIV